MRVSDKLIGMALSVFACIIFIQIIHFPTLGNGYPGPALFPGVLSLLFLIAGICMIVRGIRNQEKCWQCDFGSIGKRGASNILLVLAEIVCYIFLADIVGFIILSTILLFILMKWLRVGTLLSAGMAFFISMLIYGLFAKLLLVPLPYGIWGW
jgi:putative tricarboxylic transport membrane protein